MRISDWSSDVCSSDLQLGGKLGGQDAEFMQADMGGNPDQARQLVTRYIQRDKIDFFTGPIGSNVALAVGPALFAAKVPYLSNNPGPSQYAGARCNPYWFEIGRAHSELQSLMSNSYAVFCLKKKQTNNDK